MCLIIVGPGDIKVVIATPKELFCVCVSVKCPFTLWLCIVTKGEKSWRIMPGSFHGPDLASVTSTRVHGHHLFPRPPLTASVSEMCCLVLMCAQEEEQRRLVQSLPISATLGICHLPLNCPAYDHAFLLSYLPHSTLNWGLG